MKFVRLTLILALTGVLLFLACDLYQRQQHNYSFLSFRMDEASTSVLVPDIDRLINKLGSAESTTVFEENQDVISGVNQMIAAGSVKYNDVLSERCFLSFNAADFSVAFDNPDLTYQGIVDFLKGQFAVTSSCADGIFELNGKKLQTEQLGEFTVFSTVDIRPRSVDSPYLETNADYSVFRDSVSADRYILANQKRFRVWNDAIGPVRGNPVDHGDLVLRIPRSFDTISFYGSSRFAEDKETFFYEPEEEAFSWISNSLLVLKKDSFELMIARQNDQRDLKLILEEQTLDVKGDTVQINYLTVKNVQIMPFESRFRWKKSVPELNQEMRYFAEYQNFNVLANSFAAMRWYLAEIQTGNLINQDEWLPGHYQQSTPKKCHTLKMAGNGTHIETATWMEKNKCVHTLTGGITLDNTSSDNDPVPSIAAPFSPVYIIPYQQKGNQLVLLADRNTLALYAKGQLRWQKTLDEGLVNAPELIDLENDGEYEMALFMEKSFKVLNAEGKIAGNISRNMTESVKGGLCANYDLNYNYRFFVVGSNTITCLNESGEIVTGWSYAGSETALTGEAYYTQIAGKDYLCFKNIQNQLIILNRRGEDRFASQTASNLPNESNYITGDDENVLHKLGYSNQFIYRRYIKDGYTDSVQLDKRVNEVNAKWITPENPKLLIEEPGRIRLFNTFGYVEQEILKPQNATEFLGFHAIPEIHYVLFDNSGNSLYLLNKDGKMILSNLANNTMIYGINSKGFYTFDGQEVKEHKLN